MQKFNSISSFITELESLASEFSEENIATGTPIRSSTAIKSSTFIDDLGPDEWAEISDIIDESYDEPDIHKHDEYLYENLKDLGYSDDEITEILDFAEV